MKEIPLRLAFAQINCTVGDLEGNIRKIKEYTKKAQELKVNILSFPELTVTGYPPEDLLNKPKFIQDNLEKLKELIEYVGDIIVIVGFVDKNGKEIFNAAAVIYERKLWGIYHKMFLPNYGVFDEKRYFTQGDNPLVFSASMHGITAGSSAVKYGELIFGVSICEDIWHFEGPVKAQAKRGAKFIININASPYYAGKIKQREDIVCKQAKDNNVTIAYANLVGGQDELVFDGQSMLVDRCGAIRARAEAFKEELLAVDINVPLRRPGIKKRFIIIADGLSFKDRAPLSVRPLKPLDPVSEIYQALILGLSDYVRKNNFQKVVIGVSGGIDSALVAALAVDALGQDNVTGVFMPSRYSSQESETAAKFLADNLGIRLLHIPIEDIYKIYLTVLEPHFYQFKTDITEENLQARIRGNILMALSNKFGWLVLTTGNKSEMSTGYATLYGDMAGGFAVIKDVLKTLVYKLSRYRNSLGMVIPERIITRAPTAELKAEQKDSDTLPVYEVLDPILKAYVEEDKDLNSIISLGFDREIVERVSNMVDKSEYKRRQAPPGIKITPKAFGRDRRMPIINKYKE